MGTEFYDNIEEPIRELVRTLRDNGINTVCSCGHKMYIQADLIPDAQLQTIHKNTYNYLVGTGDLEPNYTIDIHMVVKKGIISRCFAELRMGDGGA